ncbi:NUDIX hydrolase [Streptomyces sp. PmtG]
MCDVDALSPPPRRTVRVCAVVVDETDRVLLVAPTGMRGKVLPGCRVRPRELPEAALRRGVREATGLDARPGKLLLVDVMPEADTPEEYVFVFGCGSVGEAKHILVDKSTCDGYSWVAARDVAEHTEPYQERRIREALRAHEAKPDAVPYLIHGKPAL